MLFEDLYIKANFIKFVSKFERENGSLVEFGSDITFEQKIEIIYNTFLNYVKDETAQNDNRELIEEQGISSSDQTIS